MFPIQGHYLAVAGGGQMNVFCEMMRLLVTTQKLHIFE